MRKERHHAGSVAAGEEIIDGKLLPDAALTYLYLVDAVVLVALRDE